MKSNPKKYRGTDGEVSEFAPTLSEARKTRTRMAEGVGLPSGEFWVVNTDDGRIVIGMWENWK